MYAHAEISVNVTLRTTLGVWSVLLTRPELYQPQQNWILTDQNVRTKMSLLILLCHLTSHLFSFFTFFFFLIKCWSTSAKYFDGKNKEPQKFIWWIKWSMLLNRNLIQIDLYFTLGVDAKVFISWLSHHYDFYHSINVFLIPLHTVSLDSAESNI